MSHERETPAPSRPDAQGTPPADAGKDERRSEERPKGLDYVFKISPADPKNSFDFEDVADK